MSYRRGNGHTYKEIRKEKVGRERTATGLRKSACVLRLPGPIVGAYLDGISQTYNKKRVMS
jgi:hypothetical protein